MKTNIRLPRDFYENLYNEIMSYGFAPENEDDTQCSMEIEIGDITVHLNATFDVDVIDNSFDHAFGTEYLYDLESGDLTDIDIDDISHYDEETDKVTDLTGQFDEKRFWDQFKRYGTKSNGIDIRYGDEVVVKRSRDRGAWERMIYLYTDTRLGEHICTKSLRSKHIRMSAYECMLPATTGALSIVGKTNYYLKLRV